jgi:hypothetical protein
MTNRCPALTLVLLCLAAAPKPAIVPTSEWGSKPQPIPDSRKHVPKFITIHHAGVPWKAGDDPVKKLVGLQTWGQREKKWPDLPYHFLIAPDGRIFAGRPVEYEPETNTEYKVAGHIGVELWGDFLRQRPSREQLQSLVKLTAWLAQEHKIDLKNIGAHRDRAKTLCPGRDLYRYFEDGSFLKWVSAAMAGNEPNVEPGPPLKDGPTVEIPK